MYNIYFVKTNIKVCTSIKINTSTTILKTNITILLNS